MMLDSQYLTQDDIDNQEAQGIGVKIKKRTKTFNEGLQELFLSVRTCMTSQFRISIEKMSS